MSRRAIDPVERAFSMWAALTTDEQQRFEDRRAGYCAAAGLGIATAKPAPKRKTKPPAAATGE